MTAKDIVPVACPGCGERQNRTPGPFDPDREPFGPVFCMACGHAFSREQYHAAWNDALGERPRGVDPRFKLRR